MVLSKNGMLVYIPYILEEFIKKMELDARQERTVSVEEFKHFIAYFRLHPDTWKEIMNDLISAGIIEEYQKRNSTIVFR